MNEAIDRVPMRAARRAQRSAVVAVTAAGMPSNVGRPCGMPGAPHRAGPGRAA